MFAQRRSRYSFRGVATRGCELLDPTGRVVAWTVDDCWAAIIVRLLNETDHPGVAVGAGVNCEADQPPYDILEERK